MRRLANRLYYLTETLFLRSPLYQLMAVAIVILLISITGGIVVHVTNPDAYSNTAEAVWWAFLRLTDPGYLGDDRGFFPRLVSTLLTLAGYVIFLGALVALMTNWLDRSMAFLASGRSPIFEEGHILIIGWNDRLHALVEEIVHSNPQLEHHSAVPTIVILCEDYEPSMYRELMQKLDEKVRRSCRVLVRSGDPLEIESLERVDFAYARSIILVSNDASDRASRSLSDTKLAKILMSMKAQTPSLETPPNVVVEVAYSTNKHLMESVGWAQKTEAVVADDIMGRILCQAVRFPGISRVYHRLLTDTFGDSLVLRSAEKLGLSNSSLGESINRITSGIPIGTLESNATQSDLQLLNLDKKLTGADLVILVLSRDRGAVSRVDDSDALDWKPQTTELRKRKILVTGWSTDLATFLQELAANSNEESDVTLLWEFPHPQEEKRLNRLQEAHDNLSVSIGEVGQFDDNLETLLGERYDTVVLLADQNQSPLVADAENIMRCVQLNRLLAIQGPKPHVVVELNDEDNRPLLSGMNTDIVMTSEILSHLLAQVASHRSLMWIYEELFTKGGAELRLRDLKSSLGEGVTFGQYQSACLKNHSVTLGFCRDDQVYFNPANDQVLSNRDQLIVVEMED